MRLIAVLCVLTALMIAPFLLWGEVVETNVTNWLAAPRSWWLIAGMVFALLSIDIAAPVPSSIVIGAAALLLGPIAAALVASAGMTLGAAAGMVFANRAGAKAMRRWVGAVEFETASQFMRRYGLLALVLLRPTPVLAETSVLAAGSLGVRVSAALPVLALSNIGVASLYAFAATALDGLTGVVLAGAAACVLPALFWFASRLMRTAHGDRRPLA